MNPMNLMQMFQNPQQFMKNIMGNSQIMSNPMAQNAVKMMQKGDAQGIEQMARNLCKEKNLNADEVMQQIKSKFNL
jgi:hypothetical protein